MVLTSSMALAAANCVGLVHIQPTEREILEVLIFCIVACTVIQGTVKLFERYRG